MDVLLMKVPEAAALLCVSRAKLYELIASGALPAVKVDGCRRVRRAEKWRSGCRRQAAVRAALAAVDLSCDDHVSRVQGRGRTFAAADPTDTAGCGVS